MEAAVKSNDLKVSTEKGEKKVKLGDQTFIIKHKYVGSKQMGEVMTNLIIRNAALGK